MDNGNLFIPEAEHSLIEESIRAYQVKSQFDHEINNINQEAMVQMKAALNSKLKSENTAGSQTLIDHSLDIAPNAATEPIQSNEFEIDTYEHELAPASAFDRIKLHNPLVDFPHLNSLRPDFNSDEYKNILIYDENEIPTHDDQLKYLAPVYFQQDPTSYEHINN